MKEGKLFSSGGSAGEGGETRKTEGKKRELKGGVNVFDIMRIYYRQFLVCTSHRNRY
jgi:hypothetical protein